MNTKVWTVLFSFQHVEFIVIFYFSNVSNASYVLHILFFKYSINCIYWLLIEFLMRRISWNFSNYIFHFWYVVFIECLYYVEFMEPLLKLKNNDASYLLKMFDTSYLSNINIFNTSHFQKMSKPNFLRKHSTLCLSLKVHQLFNAL